MRILDAGDACLLLELDARVDPQINAACVAIADRLTSASLPGVRDIVAAYHTVAVHIDPLRADREWIAEQLRQAATSTERDWPSAGAVHQIPVCYGDEFGPDLEDVARFAGCSEAEVVRLHSDRAYRVYMMGFLPGFPYLGIVHERLRMGRHETPRLRVPAGSVAIAGWQTGLYPQESPGGWRIIGRTWIRPFDLRRSQPLLFDVGDTVRFVPVSRTAYSDAIGVRS